MPDQPTFVIVGANLAGGRAAEALRGAGFDGRIVLVGEEPQRPYERPPLSKEYLRGQIPQEKMFLQKPEYYGEKEIELRLGVRAVGLDPSAHELELEGGERLAYDKLLLTTGGRVRRLQAPGADPSTGSGQGLEGVYYLRTVEESDRLAKELRPGRRAVVIGAGFIGAEIAASARAQGLEVTMLEMLAAPLERVLGPEMGAVCGEIHRDYGCALHTNEAVERLEGNGRVERVVGASGRSYDCDFVVVGVGIDPATELAESGGLEVNNGVVVNEYCETSAPDVYAAGDVARFYHPLLGEHIRVEHWSNAQTQGMAAAKSMLGQREPYAEIPWFWSDQYDVNLQLVGHASSWDEVVVRGDVAERKFSAFYLKDGRLAAALTVNRFRDIRPSRELIKQRVPVEAAKLRDEDIELKSLMPATG